MRQYIKLFIDVKKACDSGEKYCTKFLLHMVLLQNELG
jgi:hypothetical protein